MSHATTGYAPMGENGKLWIDSCQGPSLKQFRIYETPEIAEKNKAMESDRVVKVLILVDEPEQPES